MKKVGLILATAFCLALMSTTARAQAPILYYDFENNTTRTTFENLVEQAINSGSGPITRAGNVTTITGVSGAGTFNGGSATGQAATGTNWDSSTTDPGAAATNYYQFVVNTSGFSQMSITFDNQASATGPARVGVLFSTDGTTFTATTTTLTGNAAFSAASFDLSSFSAIDNQSSVTIRLYAFAGSAGDRTGRSAFGTGGTFRIDNLTVRARTVTASKTLLDYAAIGLSIKSGTAFNPTYTDLVLNGTGINVTLASTLNLSGTLDLSSSQTPTLTTTASFVLAHSGTSTGSGDVVGTVRRTDLGGTARAFGNPFNTIMINSGTAPTQMDVNLVKSAPGGFSNAITRTYTLTPTGGSGFMATVRLHYLDSELNGNSEATLKLFRFDSPNWTQITPTTSDTINNWVEASGITTFSPWTISSNGPIMPVCSLTPSSATNAAGTSHTVTVTVTNSIGGSPLSGVTVNFLVTMGPNAGANGTAMTDSNGQAMFMYMSNGTPGTDTIQASGTANSVMFSCTATKTWIVAACSLSPATATNPVNSNHTVTVTVTRDGSAASGISVSFNVTTGPNAGASGSGTTDGSGHASFTYTSNGTPGTDTIQASGNINGVSFSCTATKVWVAVGCTISPDTATNPVGASHTVTATVTQNGMPVSGVTVNFDITSGPNAGTMQSSMTDSNGQASFTYMSNGASGTDTIEASGAVGVEEIPVMCTATKTWIAAACSLSPSSATNRAGGNHTVTVTVTKDGSAAAGISVNFKVLTGPNANTMGSGTTDGSGQASFTYTSNGTPGTDTIEASGNISGVTFSCTATKTWIDVSCSLAPATATNPVSSNHTVTVTVMKDGSPAPSVMVNFKVLTGPNANTMDSGTTDGSGQASFTYMSNGTAGTDTIEASGNISGVTFSCTATKTWIAAACSLSPATATNFVGMSHTVTVTVTRDGSPASSIPVSFNVTSGPNAGANGTGTTDGSGHASFTYTSNGTPGTDTIEASGDISGVTFTCTAMKTWIAVPPVIINEVDSDTPSTDTLEFVELYDGGAGNTPLDGLVVVFYNGSNDQSYAAFDLDGFSTNANGYFLLGNAGVTPTPSIIFADNFLQNGADAVALYIGNASSFPNGTAVTTTNLIDALVYDTNDADDAGLLVLLNSGQPQVNEGGGGDSATQSNQRCPNGSGGGRNTSTYIQAAPTPGATNACPVPTCSLAPATATNPVSTSHTVTVTVTQSGSPVSGVAVTFTVTSGPNTGATGMGTTDTNGHASFTYTSNGMTGTDTIEASGSVNNTMFSCTAMKTWVMAVVACTLTPATATNPAGTSHTVTATVTQNGNPASGVMVSFTVTAGPNAGATGSGTTDSNGQAMFTYTSNGTPGADTIEASGTVSDVQFSCTAMKTWTAMVSVIINEVDSDTAGTDMLEFVELYDGGAGNTPLDGLVVLFYNGSNDQSYAAFDLDGFTTDANGYFLLGNAGVTPTPSIIFADNFLQNGADAVALYAGNGSDFPNGTSVTTTNLIDAIVYDTDDADDAGLLVLLNSGQPQVNEAGGGNSAGQSNQRCPNGAGGARHTNTYIQATPTPGATNHCPSTAACSLAPATATNPVGASHTVTVTVTQNGNPASGVAVSFSVTSGPNAGASGSGTTDSNGQTTFTYTSNGQIGTDTIEASGSISGNSFSCTAMKTWVKPVDCALAPATATNPVGTSHTVTVTVTQNGNPASGIMVNFSLTSGPNAGKNGSGTTNNNGQATFTYTSNGQTGTDTIQASGTISSMAFSCTATKTWTALPPVIINELDADTTGTDTMEFVELYDGGVGYTRLDGLVVVFYNGSNDQSYAALDLDGFTTNANGYFVLGNAAVPGVNLVFSDNTLQNGPDAVALYIGNASDFPNGTPVTTTNLLDAVVYSTNDPDDAGLLVLLNPGQPQVNENSNDSSATDSNQRCSNGAGGRRNTSSYLQAEPTPGAANRCDVIMFLQDEDNGNCLQLNVTAGMYLFKTAHDGTLTGPAVVTQRGTMLTFQSGPRDPNLLQGGIDLLRHTGNARLQVPRGRGGRVFAIFDQDTRNDGRCP
jgi:hypothetical protein